MRITELVDKLNIVNDGTRTLLESVISSEVSQALKDWNSNALDCVIIGGCAFAYYGRPRATMDVDCLFLSESSIPNQVNGFKRIRDHSFQHIETHVEIEVLSPEYLQIPAELVKKVFDTCKLSNGIKVASPSGLVALKLQRNSYQDKSDIDNLCKLGLVDLTNWPLSEKNISDFDKILKNE
jgi:hypothetical protein